MDVVKREIESLGGSAQLSTQPGSGMTVTLKIPLTLAIIEGLLVRIGGEFFVIPLSSVDGCIEIRREELSSMGQKRIILYREELVPFVSLRDFFSLEEDGEKAGTEPDIEQIVIASAQEYRIGLVVDQVIGDYQTVIKPLGRLYRDIEGYRARPYWAMVPWRSSSTSIGSPSSCRRKAASRPPSREAPEDP